MAKEIETTNAINLISAGTQVKGDVETNSGIRIDGSVNGKLDIKGKVVIGASGQIVGDIICQTLEVSGQITGNIHAAELISLKATARVNGEIVTRKLAIEPGAVFTGACKMGTDTDAKRKEAVPAK
ncbi:MAG: polymer-forming cytoskeletal protein [Bacteroidales bacterium]|nr:polymer-forming cytoskeletal protein [Bacteroidales bacterium]